MSVTPLILSELQARLDEYFVQFDGPPKAWIELDGVQNCYLRYATYTNEGEAGKLVEHFWHWMRPYFPMQRSALFWRCRPEMTVGEVLLFSGSGVSAEQVKDGIEVPEGYRYDPDTNSWRKVIGRETQIKLYARLWFPGLPKNAHMPEGQPYMKI